jgi:hypothetical protein
MLYLYEHDRERRNEAEMSAFNVMSREVETRRMEGGGVLEPSMNTSKTTHTISRRKRDHVGTAMPSGCIIPSRKDLKGFKCTRRPRDLWYNSTYHPHVPCSTLFALVNFLTQFKLETSSRRPWYLCCVYWWCPRCQCHWYRHDFTPSCHTWRHRKTRPVDFETDRVQDDEVNEIRLRWPHGSWLGPSVIKLMWRRYQETFVMVEMLEVTAKAKSSSHSFFTRTTALSFE